MGRNPLALAALALAASVPSANAGTMPRVDQSIFETSGYVQASNDARVAVQRTSTALVPEDADTWDDLYWSDGSGAPILLTPGTPSSYADGLQSWWMTPDGSVVVFTTFEQGLPADTDSEQDIYRWSEADGLELLDVSDGSTTINELSADGSSLVLTTAAALDPADTNGTRDIYRWTASGSMLVSAGTTGDGEGGGIVFRAATPSLDHILFSASTGPGDDDPSIDVFEFDGTAVALRTPGTSGDASVDRAGDDLAAFAVVSSEALVESDVNDGPDVYVFVRGSETPTLITDGTTPSHFVWVDWVSPTGDAIQYVRDGYNRFARVGDVTVPIYDSLWSRDGSTVVLVTPYALLPTDLNASPDTYLLRVGAAPERIGEAQTLMPAGANWTWPYADALTADGTYVTSTNDSLVPDDNDDGSKDVYRRNADGSWKLLTGSLPLESGNVVHVTSAERIVLSTSDTLDAADTDDGGRSLYELIDSGARLVNMTAPYPRVLAATADLSRIAYQPDDEESVGLRRSSWASPTVDAVAVSGTAAVGSTLTCSPTITDGEGEASVTYVWKRDGTTLGGATAATYAAVTGDAGHALACAATATNVTGSSSKTSEAVTIATPPVTPPVEPPVTPPAQECVVPQLWGLRVRRAIAALKAANCEIGIITKRRGLRTYRTLPFRVVLQSSEAHSRGAAGMTVNVTVVRRPLPKRFP